jgi:hypothetical protein
VRAPTLSIESTTDLTSSSTAAEAPIGAIVGGVVGLLAVVCLVAGAVFIVRRRRKDGDGITEESAGPLDTMGGTTPMMIDPMVDDRLSAMPGGAHPTLTGERDDAFGFGNSSFGPAASVTGIATPATPAGAKSPTTAATYTGVSSPNHASGVASPDNGYGDIDSIVPSLAATPVQGGQDGYGAMPEPVLPSPVVGGQSGYGELPAPPANGELPPVEGGVASYGELPVAAGSSELYDGLPQGTVSRRFFFALHLAHSCCLHTANSGTPQSDGWSCVFVCFHPKNLTPPHSR